MTSLALDTLFRCEHFGRQLAVKHCLRRQADRRLETVLIRKGSIKTTTRLGAPVHAHCAEACELGRQHAAATGVARAACPSCGSALVGEAECGGCREAASQGAPPAIRRAAASARLWTGEVPDVPIAPLSAVPARLPPAPTYTLRPAAAARAEEPLFDDPGEEDDEASTPHQPATPAQHQETTMPPKTEKPRQGCEHCGNRTIHKATCPKRAAKTPPPPRPRLTAPARASVTVRALPQVEDLPDEYLLACVAEREARVERIQREAQERVARLTGKAA